MTSVNYDTFPTQYLQRIKLRNCIKYILVSQAPMEFIFTYLGIIFTIGTYLL